MKYLILSLSVLLASCGVTTGYVGNVSDKSKLSTVDAPKFMKTGFPAKYEQYLLLKSGDVEVGSFVRGYPDKIDVIGGENHITFEYQNNLNQTLVGAVLSTGAIGGALNEATRDKHIFSIDVDLKPGHDYSIMFYPNLVSGKNVVPQPWVIDKNTREIVYGVVPQGVKDPLSFDNYSDIKEGVKLAE